MPLPPTEEATIPRQPSRWRFGLGSILLVMTVLAVVLAAVRAIPLPEPLRRGLLALACVWLGVALLAVGPAWLRFLHLRRLARRREDQLRAWLDEARRQHEEQRSA